MSCSSVSASSRRLQERISIPRSQDPNYPERDFVQSPEKILRPCPNETPLDPESKGFPSARVNHRECPRIPPGRYFRRLSCKRQEVSSRLGARLVENNTLTHIAEEGVFRRAEGGRKIAPSGKRKSIDGFLTRISRRGPRRETSEFASDPLPFVGEVNAC